ncbi:hypothetical protein FRC18_007376 [Serendipita sp. 400]|nr:hypothetical protein FRC18_007376 [Serendipita sp. 400]
MRKRGEGKHSPSERDQGEQGVEDTGDDEPNLEVRRKLDVVLWTLGEGDPDDTGDDTRGDQGPEAEDEDAKADGDAEAEATRLKWERHICLLETLKVFLLFKRKVKGDCSRKDKRT